MAAKCSKKRFASWADANLEICRIMQRQLRGPDDKLEKRAYKCPKCRGWHLTSWEYRNRGIRW